MKPTKMVLLSLLFFFAISGVKMGWLTDYQYRKRCPITGSSGAGTGYVLPIEARFDDYYIISAADGIGLLKDNQPSAAYYNGRTYLVFQGPKTSGDGDPFITYYDHSTKKWAKPVKIANNPLPSGDLHGPPCILIRKDTGHVGKILVAFGGHSSYYIKWVESTNSEDISSWGTPADLGQGSFPKLFQLPSGGDIYCFYRTHGGTDSRYTGFAKMAAGGSSWNAPVDLLDWHLDGGDTTCEIITSRPVYDSTNGKIWFSVAQATQGTGCATFEKAYCFAYKISDGKVYDVAGNSFSTPVARSTFDNASYKFVVYSNTGNEKTYPGCLALDSNNYPHIIFGRYDGTSTWYEYYVKWDGSAWTSAVSISDVHSHRAPDLILINTSNIDVFMAGPSGNCERWNYNGSSWSKAETILAITKEPNTTDLSMQCVPADYISEFKLVFASEDFSTYVNRRIYGWGSSGLIKFSSPGYVTLNGHSKSDFSDVRFSDNDGETVLSYWIEEKVDNNHSKMWVKVNDDLGSNQSVYCYYGNTQANSLSSIINTMIKGDDGASGNFTESVAGSATLSHASGYYKLTEDSTDDAGIAGHVLSDWVFQSLIKVFKTITGNQGVTILGLYDSATIANLIGTSTDKAPLRRFYIARYDEQNAAYPNYFVIIYQDTAGTFYYWTGTAWTTTATRLNFGAIDAMIKIWSDGTNLKADILDQNEKSLLTSPASIAIASVKAFSNGKSLIWGENYTDVYYETQNIKNYFIRKYVSPEPAWGDVEMEESKRMSFLIPIGNIVYPFQLEV